MIVRHWNHVKREPPTDWRKAWAAVDRLFFDLATRPLLLSLLREALGNDIILWGTGVVERPPGRVHEWHTDIESSVGDKFVSVWVGLQNTSRVSALKLIAGSHKFSKPIQQAAFDRGAKRGTFADEDVLAWAREYDPSARFVQPETADGEAILFDGRLWHASKNTRANGTRLALLLQYAAADQRVPRPDTRQIEWPFRFLAEPLPVVVVSGKAEGKQEHIVPVPAPGRNSRNPIASVSEPLVLPLADDPAKGMRRHDIMRGWTPNASFMSAHVSVLSPGRSPHPPHVHVEEEVLIVLDGDAEILLGDSPDPAQARVERVRAGTFAYYPSYQYHTIRNASATPITYLMFKWYGPPAEIEGQSQTGLFRFSELLTSPPAKAKQSERFFERPTGYLGKLQAHVTVLQPGAGYAPHADKHDVAIIVLSGQVKAADGTLKPHGVFYFPAGVMHGMENVGKDTARYLVFEFHSPAPEFARTFDVQLARGAQPVARKPKQQKQGKRTPGRFLESGLRWLVSPLTRKIERAVDRRLRHHFGDDLDELRRLRGQFKGKPGSR
ncbi:MAG: cupin domain-containing protein [Xanthobacteraceae bacterium]